MFEENEARRPAAIPPAAVMTPEHENDDLVLLKSNVKGVTVYQGGDMNFYSAYLG